VLKNPFRELTPQTPGSILSVGVKCPKTADWKAFTKVKLGKLSLKKGRNELVFKTTVINGAFGNIHTLSLQR